MLLIPEMVMSRSKEVITVCKGEQLDFMLTLCYSIIDEVTLIKRRK